MFSFDPMKNMPSFGTGGMVLTDSKDVYDTVISLRRHGLNGKTQYGYNSLISEDHANQLLLLLSKFDKLQKMRKKVFERYKKNLAHTDFVETQENTQSSLSQVGRLIDRRDELKTYLAQNGIETKVHYTKTLDSKNVGQYPNAEIMCAKSLSLPIYPHLKLAEVDYICDNIRKFNGV